MPFKSDAGGSAAAVGRRLDRLPFTAFHRRLLLAIGAGLLVDGFDVYLASGVAGALVKQGVASLSQVAQLNALTFVGLGAGGFIAGLLGDRIGRRRTLQWTLAIVILGSIASALAQNMTQLVALRFCTALGLGGETVLGYAMASEFLPPSKRGRWLAGLGLLANLGMPLALFAGYFVLPHPAGWRWMLVVPGVAALGVVYLRRRLSESPRWLAANGRDAEALEIVEHIERTVDGPLPPATPEAPGAIREPLPDRRLRTLFAAGNRRRLLLGAAVNVGIMSSIFGFVSWLPTFFASEGKDIASSVLFAGIMSIGSPLGVIIGLIVTERIERRWGIVVFATLAAVLGLGYAFAHTTPAIVIMGFLVVTTIYITGTLGMTGYVPELFPTALRMRGVGFCATIGRVVGICLPFAVVPVFSAFGQAGVVSMIALILLGLAAIVGLFGIYTNGRPLESVGAANAAG